MTTFCAYCSPQEHTAQRCYDYFERRLIQCALDGDWSDITHIGIELRERKRLLAHEQDARACDRENRRCPPAACRSTTAMATAVTAVAARFTATRASRIAPPPPLVSTPI